MKALRLDDLLTFSYVDVPDPAVGDEDVLVAVRACGICGSDVHGYDGTSGRRTPPLIMGHEAAGVVVRVGSDVSDWQPGDRVTFESTLSCGTCPACLAGRSNLCERREVVGASFPGYRRDGAFAEHVAVPGRALVRLPDELTFERAAFAEPLAVALHAVGLAGDVAGATAAVVGTGVIGLLAVQALRLAGAKPRDRDRPRRAAARARPPARRRRGLSAGRRGPTGASPTSSSRPSASRPRIRTAVACAGRGGRIVLVGNVTPVVELPLQAVVTGELTLVGSCASSGELERGLELLASGAVEVDPLISAVAPLAEGQVWFDRLHAATHGLVKVILTPPNGKA